MRQSVYISMSCEVVCTQALVRCVVTCVRVKSIMESVQDVRACGPFFGVQCAIALLHTFAHGTKLPENATFCLKN